MRKLPILFTALLLLAFQGCGQQSTAPEPVSSSTLGAGDVPAEVQMLLDRHAIQDDKVIADLDLVTDPNFPSLTDTSYDVYAVTYLWGTFFPPGSANTVNWTGNTNVNVPADMRLVALFDFEPGQDSIRPTTHPGMIAWRSFTQDDLDGLSFLLFVKRTAVTVAAQTLKFETEAVEFGIPVHMLKQLNTFYHLGAHNGVAVHAHRVHYHHCPKGVLAGRWIKADLAGSAGTIEGIWATRNSDPIGHLSGHFWTDDAGNRLMEGSVSGWVTDEVILELEGTWWYDDIRLCPMCGSSHGWFEGRFKYLNGEAGGRFKAEVGWPLSDTDLILPFRGRWRVDCPSMASDELSPSGD
jgi:hypothetical protein